MWRQRRTFERKLERNEGWVTSAWGKTWRAVIGRHSCARLWRHQSVEAPWWMTQTLHLLMKPQQTPFFVLSVFIYTLLQEIYSRLRMSFVKVTRPLLVEDCASSDGQTMLPSVMLLPLMCSGLKPARSYLSFHWLFIARNLLEFRENLTSRGLTRCTVMMLRGQSILVSW